MQDRRIIYVLEPFPFPAGGVAAIYRHVEILSAHGIPAYVALPKRPAVDFYNSKAPLIIHGGRLPVKPGDIWVTPEAFPNYVQLLASSPAKRLMFCQNHYYLPFPPRPAPDIREFGTHGIIVSSEAIRTFFRDVYGQENLPLLPYAIDQKLFKPAANKKLQIAFMPRKLPDDAAFILAAFRRIHPRFSNIPWIGINNVSQNEAARVMADSAIFLSLSHKDSFGLPPLEAMSCGCLVAGYHGDGGREYMTPENGWWAETGDWKSCVAGLAAALALLERGGPELSRVHEAMAKTVARYSPDRLESELLAFWKRELAQPFP